jgi:hypothetical protein
MKPAIIQLPDIYRGCIYPVIFFRWKDQNGDPFNLNGWVPLAFTRHTNLNPIVVDDPALGVTRIGMNRAQTSELRLGKEAWDWIWVTGGTVYPPILSGTVAIRDPLSDTVPPLPAHETDPPPPGEVEP